MPRLLLLLWHIAYPLRLAGHVVDQYILTRCDGTLRYGKPC